MNTIPKIYRLGDRFTQGIFDRAVCIQEKIDGSQFSFGMENGALVCRSKSTEINQVEPGMFKAAVDKAIDLFAAKLLPEGYQFQCEYLSKPKHNVLAYERVPKGNLMLFDVRGAAGEYLAAVPEYATRLGIEAVPTLFVGPLSEFDAPATIKNLLERSSVLGGQKVEGVVIKNYFLHHKERGDRHPLTAKVVSEQFKERQASKPRNPKREQGEEVQAIISALRTEARWVKAVGALRDAGTLQNSPKDIGPLMQQLFQDLDTEEADWIKEQLFEAFRKQIIKGVAEGFPQWYLKLVNSGGLSVYQQTLAENKSNEPENTGT